VESYNDHRIAMSLWVAGLMAEGETKIKNAECVNISYPDFYKTFDIL
jgi:3-phosphoshikimate 1-carboxyvinyltransferase